MRSLLITFIVLYPVVVITLLTFHRDSTIARYLSPRFLREPRYPKLILRQSGTAWLLLGAWLLVGPFSLLPVISLERLKDSAVLTTLFAFVLPVTGATLALAGLLQLCKGVFSSQPVTSPAVESLDAVDPDLLDRYLHRLSRYLRINIASLTLTIAVPIAEAAVGIEPSGWVVLANVGFLITFILTIHRLRFYTAKCTLLLGEPPGKFLIPPYGVLNILSTWILAYRLAKLGAKPMPLGPAPDQPTRSPVVQARADRFPPPSHRHQTRV